MFQASSYFITRYILPVLGPRNSIVPKGIRRTNAVFKKVFDDAKKVFRHPSRGVAKHFFGKTMSDAIGERCEIKKNVWRFLEQTQKVSDNQ